MQIFFKNAERVYFVSQHNQRITQQQLGKVLTNSEVIRNPFMVTVAGPLPWPTVATDEEYRLGCVARMWPKEKGQDLLLNVLALEKWRSRPVRVRFYGEGPMERGLEEMARYLALDRVEFCGFSRDITAVWRENHALVLPSRSEGLPLSQVEAMMCGRPVIVAVAGGTAEIVVEGETGFIASSPSVEELDKAMDRAWAARDRWQTIGVKAAEEVRKFYPEDPCATLADKLEIILAGVLS
jgi:glycosyltransferase involved in cell wall biosynthesis